MTKNFLTVTNIVNEGIKGSKISKLGLSKYLSQSLYIKMVGHQLQQPSSLENLANIRLAGWITSQAEILMNPTLNPYIYDDPNKAEDMLSQQINDIRNNITHRLPGKLQNELFIESMRQLAEMLEKLYPLIYWDDIREPFYQRHVPDRMLEIFFTKDLTSLLLDGDLEMFVDSFASHSSMLSGLVSLKLESDMHWSRYGRRYVEPRIIQLVKELRNLKHLSIRSLTNNILTCVAENCKQIEQLDYFEYYLSTENTFDALTQLPCLKSVNFYEPSFPLHSEREYEKINKRKKEVLESSAQRKEFQLKSYVSYGIEEEELYLIFKQYPLLEELTLIITDNMPTLNSYLKPLKESQNLSKLVVYFYDFYEGQIKEVLQVVGSNLRILELRCVENIDLNALKYISLTCQHLQELYIFHDDVAPYMGVEDVFPLGIEVPPFRHLQKLTLDIYQSSRYIEHPLKPFSDEFVMFFLSNCPNIEYIYTGIIYVSEETMLQVLNKNPMSHLKLLCMYYKLSDPVIDLIIENCVSPEVIVSC